MEITKKLFNANPVDAVRGTPLDCVSARSISGQPTTDNPMLVLPGTLLQMEESDVQLIAACRRGDQLAWERLIRRYQRLIYAIPIRAGLDEDHAAEIFQDVFTTLFEKLNDIEQPEKLQSWLVTTTRRKTLHEISKARVRQSDVNTDEPPYAATLIRDEAPLPDEQLVILEEQHRIRTAISSMDDRCKTLLEMLFYLPEPPSYAEIAAYLGVPEGSIGPTRARCLAKLLRMLNN